MSSIEQSPQREDRDENLTFTLPSGRTIGYARYGISKSIHPTTIYLHGYPSTRIEAAMYSRQLHSNGLTLIAIDRPGFGLSSPSNIPLSSRSILDHASDITALADHLSLDKFCLVGLSGGAPYAFATAHTVPSRVIGVGIVCGFGPYEMYTSPPIYKKLHWLNRLGVILPVQIPWLYEKIYNLVVPFFVRRLAKRTYHQVISDTSFRKCAAKTPDGKLLLDGGEEFYGDSIRNLSQAINQPGFAKHHVEEARVLAKPWPFRLEDIKHDNLRFWYGTADVNTPVEFGIAMAEALSVDGQEISFTRIEDGTHASVAARGVEWICKMLGIPFVKEDASTR